MIKQICADLNFPEESITAIEETYQSVVSNTEANKLLCFAKDALLNPNEIIFNECIEKIFEITGLHPYILNISLCVLCLEPLRKIYEKLDCTKLFETYTVQLKNDLVACKEATGIWGIKDAFWQWMFHEWRCVKCGRLTFEPFHHFCDITYCGIKKGDPVVLIHIPRGKTLDFSEVEESLRMGYEHFKLQFKNKVVPFITHSWLLYPPFLNQVFKPNGNIQKFAQLFDIISQNETGFANFSNVFGLPYSENILDKIPQETSLQRNMLRYIRQGNVMGEGYGIFLYKKDGIVKD